MRRVLPLVPIAIACLLAPTAAPAQTPEPTRAEYIAQLEPVCAANTDANRRILRGVRKRVKEDKLKAAAGQFARAATAFGNTVGTLEAVPRPSADTAKLAEWFGHLNRETDYLQGISKALRKEQRGRAQGLAVRLQHTANLANGAVTGFGFSECQINPSNYS